jgi:hypothetical protein
MSTLSATGAWAISSRAFEASLAELKRWREETAAALAAFRRWGVVNRMLDEHAAARLAYLERRLSAERLTIAFVAEYARGKSELINALFFAELGARLLPSGVGRTTLCPTEILWDPARAPSIRLLPIETREGPKALREHIAEIDTWTEVALDPSQPQTLAAACEVITESMEVDAAQAANLGYPDVGEGPVQVPRWRYAIVNFPHPLLESGLVILDTPGHNTLGSEPELTVHRLPDAAAIVFILAADTGVTRSDRSLWDEHLAPIDGLGRTCFVVLNKIDGLRDGIKAESQVLAEIDRQVKSTSEALGIAPTRIFALSALQALVAKVQGDRDALLRSRLYRLEQALSRGMIHERRLDHATAVRAETRSVFVEARTLVSSRLAFAGEQLEEMQALQGKNQKLVESLARKAALERGRLEQARAMMMGLRTVHNRHADELARLLDPNSVRAAGIEARVAVLGSSFSSGIGESIDGFFRQARERMRGAIAVIDEARSLMGNVSRKFTQDYQIPTVETPDFATERFLVELDRLEERCERDFKGTSSLLLRRRKTLGALFFDTVALKVIHVFEIADREVRTWMNGFIRPLDAQINAYQEQANTRIEGMGRIQNADTDLIGRVEEVRTIGADVAAQREQLEAHRQRLQRLLDVEPEPSLA